MCVANTQTFKNKVTMLIEKHVESTKAVEKYYCWFEQEVFESFVQKFELISVLLFCHPKSKSVLNLCFINIFFFVITLFMLSF